MKKTTPKTTRKAKAPAIHPLQQIATEHNHQIAKSGVTSSIVFVSRNGEFGLAATGHDVELLGLLTMAGERLRRMLIQ